MKRSICKNILSLLVVLTSLFIMSACNTDDNHTHCFDKKVVGVDTLYQSATCTTAAQYYYTCSCGEMSDEIFEYSEPLGHAFTNYIYNNDASCECNGTETSTCMRENCDEVDTRIDVDSALGHEFTKYNLHTEATCLENETQIATCNRDNCDKKEIIEIEGSATGHDWGAWESTGTGSHERICKNDPLHKHGGGCTGGIATCQNKAICDTCLHEYGELRNYHLFSKDWATTESHHWNDSTCGCNVKDNYGEHDLDSASGFCNICDYIMQPTADIIYKLSADGEYAEVDRYEGISTKVNISKTYLGKPVKTICSNAFYQTDIQKIIIPNSIEVIGENAFYNCDSLKIVEFEENSSLTKLGEKSFFNCSFLTQFIIPSSLIQIDSFALAGCERLTTIIVPNKVTSIGLGAFAECYRLTSITLPFIGGYLNHEDNEIHFSSHFSYIFGAISHVEDIKVPTSLNEVIVTGGSIISNNAFRGCDNLTRIQLPNTITNIGYWAFADCSSLPNLNFSGTTSEWKYIQKHVEWKDLWTPTNKFIQCLDGTIILKDNI